MTRKPKPSDRGGRHVLDADEIEELEELSLTSVITDASELPEPEPLEDEPPTLDDFDFDVPAPKD